MMPRATKHGAEPARRPRRGGLFVVIEGADASGKTTLARHLASAYRRTGIPVVAVREPGGTRVSERIRRILLDNGSLINARTELFLFLAARAQIVDEVIRPALAGGSLVIADRFSLSTIAYQVGGRRLPLRVVRAADNLARDGLQPDLTIVLSVTEKQQNQRRRRNRRRDRMESQSAAFSRGVRRAYTTNGGAARHVVLDSGRGADTVFRESQMMIDRRLSR